jgi:hypothetical protein
VGDFEQHAEGAHPEGHDVEPVHGQQVTPDGDGYCDHEGDAGEIRADHDAAFGRQPVDPGAGQQGEQQVRGQPGGGEVAHLGRAGTGDDHCQQRQRKCGDLVAAQ